MTAPRSTIQSMTGAILSLSATRPDTFDSAGYSSTDISWTPVAEIENFGNHGGTKTITEFTAVDDGVVQKVPGSKNYGQMDLMLGYVPGNGGQTLIETAFESTARYSAKIQYPAGDGESVGEVHYLDVIVSKNENQDGAANDVRKLGVSLALCRKPVKVAAS